MTLGLTILAMVTGTDQLNRRYADIFCTLELLNLSVDIAPDRPHYSGTASAFIKSMSHSLTGCQRVTTRTGPELICVTIIHITTGAQIPPNRQRALQLTSQKLDIARVTRAPMHGSIKGKP